MENYFSELYKINVNDKVEKKNGLSYVSWPYAWAEVKKRHPDAFYTVYERPDGCIYWTDGKTCWVKTGVTINNLEHIEYLPVMDFKNRSIPLDSVTSYDVNKSIQRSLTKAVARHGLGLYIYAGEDLPEGESEAEPPKAVATGKPAAKTATVSKTHNCATCGKPIQQYKSMDVEQMVRYTVSKYGLPLCADCAKAKAQEVGV